MKITDYSVIQFVIENELLEQDWTIEEYMNDAAIILAVSNIYTTNDLISGFGQDFKVTTDADGEKIDQKISIVSSRERISIILDSHMSYYKSDVPICGYESIDEDIAYIFMVLQLVFDRIESQM